jgi:leucyl aminopeptidase
MLSILLMENHLISMHKNATPLHVVPVKAYAAWAKAQPKCSQNWLKATGFKPKAVAFSLLPDVSGALAGVVAVVEDFSVYAIAHLPKALPEGVYAIATALKKDEATQLALGWLLGCYQFTAYKKSEKTCASLVLPKGADAAEIKALVAASTLARNLINTPANDLLPDALAASALAIAKKHKAVAKTIVGEQLLKANYPLIYAVGKASTTAPRLVDFSWGNPKHPKVTLVGKGVCFDSGGLDIKPSSNMRMMKKDMGGAAVALALADCIMSQKLPVRLRVLLPMVENAVAGNAMRPLDVIKSRKGLTVEIGNTDAEGRLILCDALAEADSEKPALLIDFATLTGAARVALGTDIPALFTADDTLANALQTIGTKLHDPLYRLPLYAPYRAQLNSKVADISNDPETGQGGAISAALYLKEFVEHANTWAHIDLMAWNMKDAAGRPQGGEAQTLRTVYSYIKERYV